MGNDILEKKGSDIFSDIIYDHHLREDSEGEVAFVVLGFGEERYKISFHVEKVENESIFVDT